MNCRFFLLKMVHPGCFCKAKVLCTTRVKLNITYLLLIIIYLLSFPLMVDKICTTDINYKWIFWISHWVFNLSLIFANYNDEQYWVHCYKQYHKMSFFQQFMFVVEKSCLSCDCKKKCKPGKKCSCIGMSLGMMHRFMSGIMNVFLTTKKDDDNDCFFIIFHVLYHIS